jgi:hypothetical protein
MITLANQLGRDALAQPFTIPPLRAAQAPLRAAQAGRNGPNDRYHSNDTPKVCKVYLLEMKKLKSLAAK